MHWWEALILGIVEGVTEYLPVSSTGHLLLAQRLMDIPEGDAANAYAICIQSGAILAVAGLYWRRLRQMGRGLLGRDRPGRRLALSLIVALLTTVVVYKGAEKLLEQLLHRKVEEVLFHIPHVAAAWLIGGLAILAVVYFRPRRRPLFAPADLEGLTVPQAALIGLLQALAVWPGTSRSLVTIVGGLLVGLGVGAAVEFSFLLGVVTLLAATVKDLKEHGPLMMQTYTLGSMLLGLMAAAVSAAIAVKWMVAYLRRHSLAVFGWYRLVLAAIVGLMLLLGWLT